MFIDRLKNQFHGFLSALGRYPLVLAFLVVMVIVNIVAIQKEDILYSDTLYTLLIGTALSAVAQQIYEHFFDRVQERVFLYIGAILLTVSYYFAIHLPASAQFEVEMKTGVLFFALIMVFVSLPSIKSEMTFDKSFMATVKAFFTMLLFTVVIAIGVNLVIFAVDHLLISVNGKVYSHVFNIVLTLFAPLFFLSLIPKYVGVKEGGTEERYVEVMKATAVPKLFEVLLSYIMIPLASIYTFILVVYVLSSIRSGFWSDNLLEPMLVSYSIAIILIVLLVSQLTNAFSRLFAKVIPKVLMPIVLLQLIASILKIGELGLTHGRYYVILYGVFALIASVVFSFLSIKKSGWLAAVLIVFSVVSIIPPIDAFTVSRMSQVKVLEQVLVENGMLEGGKIIPNVDISDEDKKKITKTARYLDHMNYVEKIDWLPNDAVYGIGFKEVFGFNMFGEYDGVDDFESTYLEWGEGVVLDVEAYDRIVSIMIDESELSSIPMDVNGVDYELQRRNDAGVLSIALVEKGSRELIQINMNELFKEVFAQGTIIGIEDATVTHENEKVQIDVIVNDGSFYHNEYSGSIYLLIDVK